MTVPSFLSKPYYLIDIIVILLAVNNYKCDSYYYNSYYEYNNYNKFDNNNNKPWPIFYCFVTTLYYTPLSTNSGPDGQLLLCSESMLSSTPQSLSSDADDLTDLPAHRAKLLQQALTKHNNNNINTANNNRESVNLSSRRGGDLSTRRSPEWRDDGKHESREGGYMSGNGGGRQKMTGSSSGDVPWFSDHAVTSSARPPGALPPGITSEAMLSASQQAPALFRTPSEPSPRLFSPHIGPYTTTASSMSPYASSGLPSQSSSHLGMSPFSAATVFYPQYGGSYSPGAGGLISGPYPPPLESYSAVLASMGGHVQHAQSSLPRSSFVSGHLPQYMGPHGPLPPNSSPGPMHRPPLSMEHLRRGDNKSPKSEHKDLDMRARHRAISPSTPHKLLALKEHQKHLEMMKEAHRLPSGKEGSLKHRILTRPDDRGMKHPGEPAPKRAKPHDGAGTSQLPPPPPLQPASSQATPHYPPHFMKGSIIQLANGELKRVEDLRTEDFVNSADISGDLKIDSSTVVRIEEKTDSNTVLLSFSVGEHRVQVTVEAMVEHPFFVFGQGWSSCQPARTLQRYGLTCHRLSVGDVCISLTHKDVNSRAAEISRSQQKEEDEDGDSVKERKRRWSAPEERTATEDIDVVGTGTTSETSSPDKKPTVTFASPLESTPTMTSSRPGVTSSTESSSPPSLGGKAACGEGT